MRFRLPLLLAAATLLAGCFQIDAVLTVRPDGSAELRETASANGLFGFALHQAARELAPGADRSDVHGDGVTVRSVETSTAPGRAVVTTVYDIADVSAFRYDLTESGLMAGDGNPLVTTGGTDAPDGDAPDGDAAAPDASSFRFRVAPGADGDASRLVVTVPAGADFPDADDFRGLEMLGLRPEGDVPSFQDMMILMGDARLRFAVRAASIEDADAGWHDGDTVTLTDIDLGVFLEYLVETGATPETLAADDPAHGVALPGYRTAPAGAATILFR